MNVRTLVRLIVGTAVGIAVCYGVVPPPTPAEAAILAASRVRTVVASASPAPLVYVANYTSNSVTAYPATASGNVAPALSLAGPHTLITSPIGLAHDSQGRLFVACQYSTSTGTLGRVLVFARGASGDATPQRTFGVSYYPVNGGPGGGGYNAGPVYPVSLAVDSGGYTYVGVTPYGSGSANGAIAVFSPSAKGTDAPLRAFDVGSALADPYVAVNAQAQVYAVTPVDRFNAATLRKFSTYATGNAFLGSPPYSANDYAGAGSVAVSARTGYVYTIDKTARGTTSIVGYDAIFTKWLGMLGGSAAGLGTVVYGIALDTAGVLYVGTFDGPTPNAVRVFAPLAHGNVAPVRTIAGSRTGIRSPTALTVVQ